jgi:hypothetical protein
MAEATEKTEMLLGKFDKGILQGYTGEGSYVFDNCKYIGEFKGGVFHGKGTVYIKDSGKWQGTWESGKMKTGSYIFSDGLEYKNINSKDWVYCSEKDPRFFEEIKNGNPNDESGLEFDCPRGGKIVALPAGCFDFGEGYYDPKKLSICSFQTGDPLRVPDKEEKEFIVTRCRKG